jgi:enterochelin esterase-like enzyme
MWLDRTDQLHDALDAAGVDHEYNVFPGDHWGPYWTEHIPDYLRFYDGALNPLRRL